MADQTKKSKSDWAKDFRNRQESTVESCKSLGDNQWEVYSSEGWVIHTPYYFDVKAGMNLITWSGPPANYTRGIVIDNKVSWYRDPDEAIQDHEDWKVNQKRKRIKEFAENKDKLDARYDALPDVFKKRLDKFRKSDPMFRVDFESYELFCCEEAWACAKHYSTLNALQSAIETPEGANWPDMASGHSGNTHGCSVGLAQLCLSDSPEFVYGSPPGLAPLTGYSEEKDV
jgi:hypothetical protein